MVNEEIFRIFAHSSLLFYIVVLAGLLIYITRITRNRVVKWAKNILLFWLLLALKDIAYFFGDIWYDKDVTNVLMSIDLWATPITGLFFISVLQRRWLDFQKCIAATLPFFIFTLLNIIFKGNDLIFIVNQIYGFAFTTVLSVIVFVITSKCKEYSDENCSDKESIDIRWVRFLCILFYVICVMWLLVSLCVTWLGDSIYYLSTTLLSCVLFYFAFKHKNIFAPNYMSFKEMFKNYMYNDMSVDESVRMAKCYAEIEAKLEKAIYEDKVFLNPQLSLSDLAMHIGTNRTYLSRYINIYKSTPFITYINDIRLKEAHRLLKDNPTPLPISEISEKCGFASYSTFRRVFKQKYGYSPSQCRDGNCELPENHTSC